MKFTLEQARHALAVGRFRHFGRAAEHLDITQPALSRSIKALEERLGCRLFDRSRNGVRPTAKGVAFLEQGAALLDAAMRLQAEVGGDVRDPRNELSMACGLFPAELTLGRTLGRLGEALPELGLAVEIADWTRAHALLTAGTCQLFFGEISAGPEFASRLVNQEPLKLVVRRGHPLTRQRRPGPEEVFAYPWVSPRIPPRTAAPFLRFGAMGRLDDQSGWFSPAVVTPSLSAALSVSAASDCVAPTPLTFAESRLNAGMLQLVRFRAPWLRMNYGFSWRRGEPLTRAARFFMDLAEEEEADAQAHERELSRAYRYDRWEPVGPDGEAGPTAG